MKTSEFRAWLHNHGTTAKVSGDIISRLKRIEHEIKNCDIDDQYRSDRCETLLELFSKMGLNEEMKKYPSANFPIGKYHMGTYRHALKKYIRFSDDITSNAQ